MEPGKKIWVETLMTPEEWKTRLQTFPTSTLEKIPEEFEGDFKWRKGMGAGFSQSEIDMFNARLDKIMKTVKNGAKKEEKLPQGV